MPCSLVSITRTLVLVSSEEPSDFIPPGPDFNLHHKNLIINTKRLCFAEVVPMRQTKPNRLTICRGYTKDEKVSHNVAPIPFYLGVEDMPETQTCI